MEKWTGDFGEKKEPRGLLEIVEDALKPEVQTCN